jgi:hypothetical protein
VSALTVCWAVSLAAAAPEDQNPPSTPPPAPASAPPAPAAGTPLASPASASPTPAPTTPPAPPTGVPLAPKKVESGNWWEKSSLDATPQPTGWLFHAAGTFSYMNATGNTSGSTVDLTAGVDVRKSHFTSHSFVQVSRRNMIYGFTRSSVNYIERTIREQVDCDITWYLRAIAGVEQYRNTLIFMDKRLTVYGGIGGTLYRNAKQQLTLSAGLGHAGFTFDRAQMMRVNPSQIGVIDTSPDSGGALVMQTWRWKPSPRFNFSEDAGYMKYFLSSLGYHWTINLNGNFPIDKRFSFNVSYRVKEETNTIIKALGVFEQDRSFLLGIKVSI